MVGSGQKVRIRADLDPHPSPCLPGFKSFCALPHVTDSPVLYPQGTLETDIEKAREEGNWKKVIELATQLKDKGEKGNKYIYIFFHLYRYQVPVPVIVCWCLSSRKDSFANFDTRFSAILLRTKFIRVNIWLFWTKIKFFCLENPRVFGLELKSWRHFLTVERSRYVSQIHYFLTFRLF